MADKMKFGLIGCGSQGRYLSDALNITGLAETVACADLKPEAAEAAARQCGYRETYDDAGEMLSKADLDAVIVATMHDRLQPCGMAVVEAGKHLFIEKPMALNAAEGRRLVEAANRAGVKIMVGYTLPFLPARVRMKQLLDRGVIGDIVHVTAGQLIGSMGGWLATREHGGGPLLYVGVHALYQVLDVVPAKAVRVFAEAEFTPGGVDLWSQFTLRFESGIAAQITSSQRMGGRYGWIDVVGTDGLLRSEWESNQLIVQSRKVPEYRERTAIEVEATAVGPAVGLGVMAGLSGFRYVRSWAAEFMEFIAAIRENREPRVNGREGLRVLEITDAVIESGKTGKPVSL